MEDKNKITLSFGTESFYEKKHLKLSSLCDLYGSDKGTMDINIIKPYSWNPHTYTDYYSNLFDHCRSSIKFVFECGIGNFNQNKNYSEKKIGSSLKVWRDYFYNAIIYSADINQEILFEENRIKTFDVDQTIKKSIDSMWKKNKNKRI